MRDGDAGAAPASPSTNAGPPEGGLRLPARPEPSTSPPAPRRDARMSRRSILPPGGGVSARGTGGPAFPPPSWGRDRGVRAPADYPGRYGGEASGGGGRVDHEGSLRCAVQTGAWEEASSTVVHAAHARQSPVHRSRSGPVREARLFRVPARVYGLRIGIQGSSLEPCLRFPQPAVVDPSSAAFGRARCSIHPVQPGPEYKTLQRSQARSAGKPTTDSVLPAPSAAGNGLGRLLPGSIAPFVQ